MSSGDESYLLRFVRQSSHYFSGYALVMIGGFISFPILTRIFSRSDYGIISIFSITLWLLLAVTKAGMQESAVRFYSEFESGQRREGLDVFYTTLFFGSVALALAVCLLTAFGGLWIFDTIIPPDSKVYIWLLIALLLSGSVYQRLLNFLRAEQRTKILNAILVINRYFGLALALVFIAFLNKSVKSYYSGLLLAEVLLIFFLVIVMLRQKKIRFGSFSFPFLKECLLFGVPLIGVDLANFLLKSTDRYIIQFFLGLESVGLYSAGSNLCLFLKDGVLFPVAYAVMPLYMEMWQNKGKAATSEFISRIINYVLLLIIPITVGFSVLSRDVIVLLATEKFEQSAGVIPYILPGALLWGLSPLFAAGLYIHKQTKKITSLVFIGFLTNLILNLILIPALNLVGAALATLITYFILTAFLLRSSLKYFRLEFDLPATVRYFFAAMIMGVVLFFIELSPGVISIFIKILTGFVIYTAILTMTDSGFRKMVINIWKMVSHRIPFTHKVRIDSPGNQS